MSALLNEKRLLKTPDSMIDLDSSCTFSSSYTDQAPLETRDKYGMMVTSCSSSPAIYSSISSKEISIISQSPNVSSARRNNTEESTSNKDKRPCGKRQSETPRWSKARENSSMESLSMLDGTTTKRPPRRKAKTLADYLRAVTMMKSGAVNRNDTSSSSPVVEDQETGPVCLIQNSPLRIFKVCKCKSLKIFKVRKCKSLKNFKVCRYKILSIFKVCKCKSLKIFKVCRCKG